jgi:hypothetical protein
MAARKRHTNLRLPSPLDLNFDIEALLSSATELGDATAWDARDGVTHRAIRRLLNPLALTRGAEIPIWQQLVDGKEWRQCSPAMCANFEEMHSRNASGIGSAEYRRIMISSSSIGNVQLPHPLTSPPYLAPVLVTDSDFLVLTQRVHESLPEWDITKMEQVVNGVLDSKYASRRYQLAKCCNGDPNERMLFHLPPNDGIIRKIWQAGEGFETRLAQWAEVGKGAYFCEHAIYCYAYKFGLWAPSDKMEDDVKEPPVGKDMQVFVALVCLGNVADMGPGCESCPSPKYQEWKQEFPKSAEIPSPVPTRPPAINNTPSSDPVRWQHTQDIRNVKEYLRYDSVSSTEGDLATHPDSNCKNSSGKLIREVLHQRLKKRAKEWGKQYVLFDSSSYPMFLLTLTKTRLSPWLQEMVDAEMKSA